MTRALMPYTQPTFTITVTVNINADRTLLFTAGLFWLVRLALVRLGRFINRVSTWLGAAGRVLWRRLKRWVSEWKADLQVIGQAVRLMIGGSCYELV